MDRRDQRGDRRVARVEQHQPLVREQLGQQPGKRRGPSGALPVVPGKPLDVRCAVRQVRQFRGQRFELRRDLAGERGVRDGGAVCGARRQRQRQRFALRAADLDARDLRQVVVLGLQPEDRDHRPARLRGQRARHANGAGGLVERKQWPEKQPDLLAGHDCRSARGQRGQVRLARGARREAAILRGERAQQRGGDGTRRAAESRAAVVVLHVYFFQSAIASAMSSLKNWS